MEVRCPRRGRVRRDPQAARRAPASLGLGGHAAADPGPPRPGSLGRVLQAAPGRSGGPRGKGWRRSGCCSPRGCLDGLPEPRGEREAVGLAARPGAEPAALLEASAQAWGRGEGVPERRRRGRSRSQSHSDSGSPSTKRRKTEVKKDKKEKKKKGKKDKKRKDKSKKHKKKQKRQVSSSTESSSSS